MKFIYLSAPDYIRAYCEIADILAADYHGIYNYSTDTHTERDGDTFCDCVELAESILYRVGIKKECI